jgi:uncharacterized protein (TIGR02246 family)
MVASGDLEALLIDRAVRDLTARYCDAVARCDGDLFATLWSTDADWVVPGARTTSGRERIARLFMKLREDYVLCTQELMSGRVVPAPEAGAARARWQIREFQWKDGAPVSCVMGIYTDRLLVEDGAWRFAERRFDIVYRGPVDLSAAPTPLPADLPVL